MDWIFSALSVAATLGVAWLTWRQKQLDSKIVDIEEARESDRLRDRNSAQLKARLLDRAKSGRLDLVVENSGQARADDVHVILAGVPVLEHDCVFSEGPEPGFSIGPGSPVTFKISVGMNTEVPPWDLECRWSDAYETDRTYRTTLT